jgi:YcaO-like protein with predicted kinase domain
MSAGPVLDVKVVTTGTHRVRTFDDTWAAVSPRLRDMGITRVANVTGLDHVGIPVVMVTRPNARTLAVSQGKGLTLQAARLSGVMEAAELFHAEEADLPVCPGTPPAPVDIQCLPLQRPGPIPAEPALDWVEGEELLSGGRRWVPHHCVVLGRSRPEERVFASTSSGLAAGNSRMEALSHAICELVERHAMTTWHSLPNLLKDATGIDLTSVEDAACRSLFERCSEAGIAVGAWNMTGEVEIPAFACYLADRDPHGRRVVQPASGYGCHPSRAVALARAVTEAIQSRLTHIAGARDDMSEVQYTEGTTSRFSARVLEFIASAGAQDFAAVPSRDAGRISTDVAWELERLREASIDEVVAVDLTRRELGIPVVRLVVPGLRIPGFWSASDAMRPVA